MNHSQIPLFTRRNHTMKLSLDRVKALLRLAGDPQERLSFVHIAGTTGKGSVAAVLANVLKKAGYRTGLFVSPYVRHFSESIQVDNRYLGETEAQPILDRLALYSEGMEDKPTPFEITTALAFCYFDARGCDVVCLETGLGGRTDATNCVENTLVSVITLIDYDHMEFLGNSLEEIAFEKCGIIKENKITLSYPLQPERAARMIRVMARIRHNEWAEADLNRLRDVQKTGACYRFVYKEKVYETGLCGEHQVYNALLVIEAAERLNGLGFAVAYEHLSAGIKGAVIPGRLQRLRTGPDVYLDGAHNRSAARALKRFILENGADVVLIAGLKEDKRCGAFFEELGDVCRHIIVTEIGEAGPGIKPAKLGDLLKAARMYNPNAEAASSHTEAYRKALALCGPEDMILITGSFYLLGAFYEIVCKNER